MELFMPVRVYAEDHCVRNHARELASLGSKAFIVTGKHSSRKNGSLQDVTDALTEQKIPYVIFDDIEENPSVETVMKAREIGIKEKADFCIGIGGGSPMDASKAISLMIANPKEGAEILYQKKELPYLPLAEVPTTAGTGSEVTPYAILTLHERRTKQSISHRIFPKFALVDSAYLKTASRSCIVDTAVDTLAHLLESFLNTGANAYNRMYSEAGLKIWGGVKTALLQGKTDEATYKNLSHAAVLGGMAIAHTGTSLPHGLSYPITYEMGMAHGKAVGIFLPGFLRCYGNQEEVRGVLALLGFSQTEEFRAFLEELLGPVEVERALWERDVKDILQNQAKLKNYPYEMTQDILLSYLSF